MKKGKLIAGFVLAAAVFLGCQAVNFPGGFEGGPAGIWELAATAVYVAVWAAFSAILRRERAALWVCFAAALLTLLGSLSALVPVDFAVGTLLMVLFAGVPLYGLRFFMDWTGLYFCAGAGAAVWLAWSVWMLSGRKREKKPET